MCEVKIDNIKGSTDQNKNITFIEVSGTASVPDCHSVQLELICQGFPFITTSKVVNGTWSATVTDALALNNCNCDATVTIHVQCLHLNTQMIPPKLEPVPGCETTWSGTLECEPEFVCPDVTLTSDAAENCNDDGTRKVVVTATITSADPAMDIEAELKWVEGNQTLDGPKSGQGTLTLSGSFDSPSGEQNIKVTVLNPAVCGNDTLKIDVKPCGPIGACCIQTPLMVICEDMTKKECHDKGGIYMGDNTSCATVDCDTPPPPGGEGPGECGYGLVFFAVIMLCGGIITLASHMCLGVPQLQTAAFVAGWALIGLYGVLMALAWLTSLGSDCEWDICKVAAIHMMFLGPLGGVLAFFGFFVPCAWKPAFWLYGGIMLIWGSIAAGCLFDKLSDIRLK